MIHLRKKKTSKGWYSLYLDIYRNGKRQYEFLKLYLTKDKQLNKETIKLAENIRAKRQIELQNNEYGFIPEFKKKANFVSYFEKITFSKPKTAKPYYNTLKHLRDFTKGFIQITSIDEKWLEQFKNYLLTKISQNSVHSYFNILKAVLNRAIKEKILQVNPFLYFEPIKRLDNEMSYLSFDEVQKLAETECIDPETKRAFLFGCYTGLRISDIQKLEWQDINNNSIEFRQKKTKGITYLPLSETAMKILKSDSGNILPLPVTKVFNLKGEQTTLNRIKKWVKDSGIEKKVTWHTARHTFATLSLTFGADLYTISKLLGHSDTRVTQIYAKIIDEKKREAVNLIPEIKIG